MSSPQGAQLLATAYLGLGSNIGDRAGYLADAIVRLRRVPGISIAAISGIYETDPVGVTDQCQFLNAVVALHVECGAHELLAIALRIEAEMGRERKQRWGPRNIDIDLLLFSQERIATSDLVVPHPRLMERQFVLVPLAEIAPDLVLPDGRQARDAADRAAAGVRYFGAFGQEIVQ